MQRLLLLFLVFSPLFSFSQEPAYYHYDAQNGLPCSEIYDVIQDDYGYMWFSSDFGLLRYDGYTFEHYTTKDGLPNNIVFNFFKHPNGEIWCTTSERGVFIIRGEAPTFEIFKWGFHLTQLKPFYVLKHICFEESGTTSFTFLHSPGIVSIDENGRLTNQQYDTAVLTEGVLQAYFLKNGQRLVSFEHTDTLKTFSSLLHATHLPLASIKSIHRNDALFFGEKKCTVFLNRTSMTIQEKGVLKKILFKHEVIMTGKFGKNNFWVSFIGGGVSIFDLNGNELDHYLPNQSVSKLYEDQEGGIWISTLNSGVFHVINDQVRTSITKNSSTAVYDIESDSEKVWISYKNGMVDQYKNGVILPKHQNEDMRPIPLYYDKANKTFSYVRNNLLKTDQSIKSKKCGYSRMVYGEKRDNNYYQYTSNSNFINRRDQNGLLMCYESPSSVNSILRFNDTMFVAANSGLMYLDNDKFYQYNNQISVFKKRINSLTTFNDQLILGTLGEGVILLKGKASIKTIGKKEGLTSNFISKVYVENKNTIWVCTNAGLNRILFTSNGNFTIDQLTTKQGLKSNEVKAFTIFQDTCWVGTQEGLCYFTTDIFDEKTRTYNYRLKIDNISINDSIFSRHVGSLSYKQNRLEFHFSAVSFNEARKLQYRYRLREIDNEWTYTTNRSALYPQLPSGEYTFVVQLKGENENWQTQTQKFTFTIHPPFWKTWWFISLCFTAIIVLIYLFFRFRILLFNGTLMREILRVFLKKIKRNTAYIVVKDGAEKVKIASNSIKYVKAYGNYIEIYHDKGKTMTRQKISGFLEIIPDQLEYVQVRRSYIVRIDRVEQKGKKSIIVGGETINVGSTYLTELDKILL